MDSFLRKILEETAKGNFNNANALIRKNKTVLNNNAATSIIIECCRSFVGNNNSLNIEEQELIKLIATCTKYIDGLNEEQSLSYMRSLFYIIKYFFEKNNIKIMLEMVPAVTGDFIHYDSHQIRKVHNSVWTLFHNSISKMSKEHQTNDLLYFEMCLSSVRTYMVYTSNSLLVANLATTYCKSKKCYESDPQIQCQFYKDVLHIMKINLEKNDEFYTATVRVIELGVKNLSKQHYSGKILNYLEHYKLYINEITQEEMYTVMSNSFDSVAQCFVEMERGTSTVFNKFENCLKVLKHYCKTFSEATQLSFVCNIINFMFENRLEYFVKMPRTVWATCMEESTQVLVFEILAILAEVFEANTITCKSCNGNCNVNTGIPHSVNTLGMIGNLLKISITNEMHLSDAICKKALHYLERCCAQIAALQLKKCIMWLTLWFEISIMIYNISIKLHAIKHAQTSKYFMLLLKNIIKLEGSNSEVFKIDVIATVLKCLSDIHTDKNDYKKALMFIALLILLRPNSLASSFKYWICVKAKEKQDESLQELTVASVIKENRYEILSIYPQAEAFFNDTEQLLIDELFYYKKLWSSRVPMLVVFKHIYKECNLITTVKVLVTTWDSSLLSAHNGIYELIVEIVDRFEAEVTERTSINKLYLALLYVLKYHVLLTEARKVNIKEIENSNVPSESSQITKNKYDIIPTCTNLKLSEYTQISQYLKNGLNLLDSHEILPQNIEILNECNVLNVVANIALEFRLYCDSLHSTKAWLLCLRMSQTLENADYILKSIGFLIENSSLKVDTTQKLLTDCLEYVKKIQLVDTNDAYETLTTFYINQSTMYYNNQEFNIGFDCYKKALETYKKIVPENHSETLTVRLEFLHVQYLQLPCNLNVDSHEVFSLQKFSSVCRKISTCMKEQGFISSYGLAILFEINCTLIHMYKWMFLPREVRCYSRDLVILAQQLAIPLRTAIIVSYLAHADLQSTRIDDCQTKINGLSDILCVSSNKQCTFKKDEIVCDKSQWQKNDMEEITENFSEILLDCPVSTREQALKGSPTLSKPLKLPSLLSHTSQCDCFYCLSVEYQNLLITLMHLDAEHYLLMDNKVGANYCFSAAVQVYERLTSNDKFTTKVIARISCYPFFDLKRALCQSHCTTLLGYARHLYMQNDMLKATNAFKDLINLISENMYLNIYLHNEAHVNYAIVLMKNVETKTSQQNEIEDNLLNVEDCSSNAKTPESKSSKVVFYRTYSPNPESPPKRIIPKIKCDFSEPTRKKTTKTTKSSKTIPATPSCSSEVYIPPAVQTEKKKRNILIEIPPLEDSTDNSKTNETLIVPVSPNAYTPNVIKASGGLPSRTKILTRKLKSEMAAKKFVENGKEQLGEKIDGKNSVCKNLMSELCAVSKKSTKKSEKVNCAGKSDGTEPSQRITRATARKRK